MANPSNQPAEEPIVSSESLDAELFWLKHRTTILVSAAVLVVGLLGLGAWMVVSHQNRLAADSALASAKDADGFREVIAKFPGSPAAGSAYLLLAKALRDAGTIDESTTVYENFVATSRGHPLVSGGLLGIAENAALAVDSPELAEKFREVSAGAPGTYGAQFAQLELGRLLLRQGDRAEARKVFSSLQTEFPDSPPAQVASVLLNQLDSVPEQ